MAQADTCSIKVLKKQERYWAGNGLTAQIRSTDLNVVLTWIRGV